MKTLTPILFAFILGTHGFLARAANEQFLWGPAQNTTSPRMAASSASMPLSQAPRISSNDDYQLVPVHQTLDSDKHTRYQLMYRRLPVWGHQLIYHQQPGQPTMVNGMNATDIEKDVPTLESHFTVAQLLQLLPLQTPVKLQESHKIIFIAPNQKAHLAYHLSVYLMDKKDKIKALSYIIDANSGAILKQWNNVRHKNIGQGLGGNAFSLPYRSGMFQYGNALPGLPSLGKFEVKESNGYCQVASNNIIVINFENSPVKEDVFPITAEDEKKYQLRAFSYACSPKNFYLNYTDGVAAPVQYAFSPINDSMFFATATLAMYKEVYQVKNPIGQDLPIRIFTHVGAMDNAFSIPTIEKNNTIISHQQLIIGNGDFVLTAPSQTVLAHELSHSFTDNYSGLIYEGQAGGINESFSDMAAIALEDYLRKKYPWYWDGKDWSIAREATLDGEPLRYMDQPSKDGFSIDNANFYTPEIDVHFSSGVYNKAFYLLAHQPGWSIKKAFQVMVDANQYYWTPESNFNTAACGVIQAANDHHWDTTSVINAFAQVNVRCPVNHFY